MTEVEYTEGVNLHEIHTCAWNGIIPRELVKLVQKLVSNSKHWAPKNGSTTNSIVGRINGLTNRAMCSVWEKRKEKLEDENTTSAKSKPQSILDQAKALASAGLLPGIGGVGKMTYSEFEALPKRQRSNKIQKVLRDMNNIKDKLVKVQRLPIIGDRVRSYVLNAEGDCEKQEGKLTGYTGQPKSPYQVASVDSPGLTATLSLADLEGRMENPDGCTPEESSVRDEMVTKLFQPTLTPQQNSVHEMRYQLVGKLPEAPTKKGLLPFRGGITEVHRNKQLQETLVTVVYGDQDTGTVPFNAMLEETAFNNHQDKKVRLHTLPKRRLGTPETGQASPEEVQQWASRHALKNKHTKNKKKGRCVSKPTPTNKSTARCAQRNQQKKTE